MFLSKIRTLSDLFRGEFIIVEDNGQKKNTQKNNITLKFFFDTIIQTAA